MRGRVGDVASGNSGVDVELARLLAQVMGRTELGLSVLVPAGWLTGVAISRELYSALMRQRFAAMVMPYADPSVQAAGPAVAWTMTTDNTESALDYLHLRDARLLAPNGDAMPGGGSLVRLRLDQVVGWTAGIIGAGGNLPSRPPDIDL